MDAGFGAQVQRDGRSVGSSLLQNMSAADGLACLLFMLTQYVNGPPSGGPSGRFSCEDSLWYTFKSAPWMCFTAYLLTLVCLSVSQYLAVCFPAK